MITASARALRTLKVGGRLREVGQCENDEAIVRAYVRNQLATYKWLRKHGLEFSPDIEASSGMSFPRGHTVDPADMVRRLKAKCRASGRAGAAEHRRAGAAEHRRAGASGLPSRNGRDPGSHVFSRGKCLTC